MAYYEVDNNANKTTIVNNLTATTAGSALDATQGKALSDEITSLNDSLTKYSSYTITDSYGSIDVLRITFGKISIYSFGGVYTANIPIFTIRYIDKDASLKSKLQKITILSETEGYQTSYAFSAVDATGIYTATSAEYKTGRNFYGICVAFWR